MWLDSELEIIPLPDMSTGKPVAFESSGEETRWNSNMQRAETDLCTLEGSLRSPAEEAHN